MVHVNELITKWYYQFLLYVFNSVIYSNLLKFQLNLVNWFVFSNLFI